MDGPRFRVRGMGDDGHWLTPGYTRNTIRSYITLTMRASVDESNGEAMMQRDAHPGVNPAEETIQVGPVRVRFLVTGAESNGSVAAFELSIPAGAGLPAPPHSHDAYEETIYGLRGVSTWIVDGARIDVGPGQALCIPRGAVHAFANHGDVETTALAILSPAAIGPAYFREAAAVIDAAAGGPPDRAAMVAVMRRHGLTPAPAPTST
jgi:quercetin dioxygenase-like cupin family protein